MKESKKDLVRDVHRFACLEDSMKGGFMIYHNSYSSLMVEVKSKRHINPILMELKEFVLSEFNESFSLRGMVC